MGRSCQRVQLNSNTPLSRSNLIPNYPFQSFSVHYDGAKAHRRPLHRCSPARDPCSNVAACGHEYFGEAHSLRQLLAEVRYPSTNTLCIEICAFCAPVCPCWTAVVGFALPGGWLFGACLILPYTFIKDESHSSFAVNY